MKEIDDEKLASTYLEKNPTLKENDVTAILLNCSACELFEVTITPSSDGNGEQK